MRLRKTIEAITLEEVFVGFDQFGAPVYRKEKTYHPIKCEIEPFSAKLAEHSYGTFIEATNRVFSRPTDLFKLRDEVRYDGHMYQITQIVAYDKHFETMLKWVGEADE